MRTVIRNKEGEITHVRWGFWNGEAIFVTREDEEVLRDPVSLEEINESDADSSDVMLMELLNGDITREELKFRFRKHLLTNVIREKL